MKKDFINKIRMIINYSKGQNNCGNKFYNFKEF